MIKRAINSKKMTLILCLFMALAAALAWSMQQTRAAATADVMYFVPENIDALENEIGPADLTAVDFTSVGFSALQEIGHTSDWQVIDELIAKNELDVLIIHHTVQESVDWDKVKEQFRHNGLIVAGIGMAGDDLAYRVGNSFLYERNRTYLDAHAHVYDYFIYSMQISGPPEEVAKILDANSHGEAYPQNVQATVYSHSSSNFGSFSWENGITKFLGVLDGALQLHQKAALGSEE